MQYSQANVNLCLCGCLFFHSLAYTNFLIMFSNFNLGHVLKFSGIICPDQHFEKHQGSQRSQKEAPISILQKFLYVFTAHKAILARPQQFLFFVHSLHFILAFMKINGCRNTKPSVYFFPFHEKDSLKKKAVTDKIMYSVVQEGVKVTTRVL